MRTDLDSLENFDDAFDPSESFDPTSKMLNPNGSKGRGEWVSKKGVKASFTLRLQNFTAQQQRIELFNPFGHITKVPNPAQYGLFSNVVPVSEGTFWLALQAMQSGGYTAGTGGGTPSAEQTIIENALRNKAIFDNATGNLIYTNTATNDAAAPNTYADKALAKLTTPDFNFANTPNLAAAMVSCAQIPYRQLLGELEDTVLRIDMAKMSVQGATQFDNEWVFARKTIFGKVEENTIEPSSYVNPINPNTTVIDITAKYLVDKKTGIFMTLEANEDVNITFFVTAYKVNGLSFNL